MVHNYLRRETKKIALQWVGIAIASVIAGVLLGPLRTLGLRAETPYAAALTILFVLGLSSWLLIAQRFRSPESPVTWSSNPAPLFAVATLVVVLSLPLPEISLPSTTIGASYVVTIAGQVGQCNAEELTLTCS